MFQAQLHLPQIARWQTRFAHLPRWAWITFFIGAAIPIVVLVILALAAAALTGAIVMVPVLLVRTVLSLLSRLWRLLPHDDGRRNVRIVVHGVQVIDP